MNEVEKPTEGNSKKKRKAFAVAGIVVAAALTGLFLYRGYARTHLKTDDAFVEGAIHIIAPRIPGTVNEVLVVNNQAVQRGDILVRLDPDIYVQKLAEAEAGLEAESRKLAEFEVQVQAQRTRIAAAQAAVDRAVSAKAELEAMVAVREADVAAKTALLDQAETDLKRAGNLLSRNVIPLNRYETVKTSRDTAAAALKAAEELRRQAQVALRGHDSTIHQARANLKAEGANLTRTEQAVHTQAMQISKRRAQAELARLNLSYTAVDAPADGFVTRKSVEVGNQVQAGQPFMSVVSLADAYVVANYKETRISGIRPGQRVKMRIDAYPARKFSGRVDSIMAGTGSAFTLFPPENASGNFVKVVQRVPVKIVFDDVEEIRDLLRVGMSVIPTILVE
ncbi:MAG: HlyD family secretion protein [bacterium]|nr:MAG: HlyD family secretion protein [bacterium]